MLSTREAWPPHGQTLDLDGLLEVARTEAGLKALALARFDRSGRFRDLRILDGGTVRVITAPAGVRTIRVRELMSQLAHFGDEAVPVHSFGDSVAAMFSPLGPLCRAIPVGTSSWTTAFLVVPDDADRPDLCSAIRVLVAALSEMERAAALITDDVAGCVMLDRMIAQSRRATMQADADGHLVRINPVAVELLGLPKQASLQPWRVSLAAELGTPAAAALSEVLLCAGRSIQFELPGTDDVPRTIRASSSMVQDESGECIAVWIDLEDVTQDVRAEQTARRIERLNAMATKFHDAASSLETREEVLQELCRLLAEAGDLPLAWVAENDPEVHHTRVVAQSGGPSGYADRVVDLLNSDPSQREFWYSAIHTGLPVVRYIIHSENRLFRMAHEVGLRAVGMFALDRLPETRLVLMVYSGDPEGFGEVERSLIVHLAQQVMMAMDRIRYAGLFKLAQRDLVEMSRWMFALVQSSPDAIISIDESGRVVSVNPAAVTLVGLSEEGVEGCLIFDLLTGPTAPSLRRLIGEALEGRPTEQVEAMVSVRGGARFWAKFSIGTIRDESGVIEGVVFIASDISERKRLERIARRKDNELKRMAADIVSVTDRQRREIAADLHDGLGQTLAALKMNLDVTFSASRASNEQASLGRARELTDRAIASVRTMTFDLYPSTLRTMGLAPALEAYTEECCREYPGTWTCDAESFRIGDETAATLYRVAKELMHNAAKHAQAGNVHVSLRQQHSAIELVVRDDGVGMVEQGADGLGIGLTSAIWQLERVGGQMSIASEPGESVIVVTAPMSCRARRETDVA